MIQTICKIIMCVMLGTAAAHRCDLRECGRWDCDDWCRCFEPLSEHLRWDDVMCESGDIPEMCECDD